MPPSSRRRAVVPAQRRSQLTREKILAAAVRVLVDHGLPAFNTNAVAAEAGVNVSTLYHYFPDKQAILRTLYERDESERSVALGTAMSTLSEAPDLDAWVHDVATAVMGLRRNRMEGVVVRRACRAVPELGPMVDDGDALAAGVIATALQSRWPSLTRERALSAAWAVLYAGGALVDHMMLNPMSRELMQVELERVLRGFLRELAADLN